MINTTTIIIITLFISILLLVIFRFLNDTFSHRKKMKAIKNWRQLIDQSVNWSKEIKCEKTKSKFLEFYSNNMLAIQSDEITIKKVEGIKLEMIKNFGGQIPSLKQQFRESRLKDLGI